jgi:hypothetical protein
MKVGPKKNEVQITLPSSCLATFSLLAMQPAVHVHHHPPHCPSACNLGSGPCLGLDVGTAVGIDDMLSECGVVAVVLTNRRM